MKRITRRGLIVEAMQRGVELGARAAGMRLRTFDELDRLHPEEAERLVPRKRPDAAAAIGATSRRAASRTELTSITALDTLEQWLIEEADGRRSLAELLPRAPGDPTPADLKEAFLRLVRMQLLEPA